MPASVAFCAFALGVIARAQTAPPPALEAAAAAAERQQREEQDRQREEFRRARESAHPPTTIETPAVPTPRVDARVAVRREIRALRLEGAAHMEAKVRQRLTAAYSGRALGLDDIEHLLTEITQYYLARGYVTTRAYVPDQDLTTGVLRILVVEGRIERLEGAGTAANIFPTGAGKLLNLRDLEQGIDNLNRVQSHQATLDLAPGSLAGGTDVIIRDTRTKPWHLAFSADNTGSKDTGRDQVSATLAEDDFLGFGENASVTHRRAVPYHAGSKASESTTGSVSVPWGYQSFTLGGSASSYALRFAAPSGLSLPFDGKSQSAFLRTDRVIYRGQQARLSAYANLTWRSSRNYLQNSVIGASSRDASILDVGATYSIPLAGGFSSVDAAISHGLAIFGAAHDPAGLPKYAPRGEFTALKLNASWTRGFKLRNLDLSYTSSVSAQLTGDVLYGADQLTVGGVYAVRGFDRTNLAGDSGYVWRNDLSAPFRFTPGGARHVVSVRPYVGVDQGHAWSNIAGLAGYSGPSGSLLSATAGVGLVYRRYNADVCFSAPLERAAAMPRETGRVYFRLNASF